MGGRIRTFATSCTQAGAPLAGQTVVPHRPVDDVVEPALHAVLVGGDDALHVGGQLHRGRVRFASSSLLAAPASMITLSRSTIPTNGCPAAWNVPSLNGSATALARACASSVALPGHPDDGQRGHQASISIDASPTSREVARHELTGSLAGGRRRSGHPSAGPPPARSPRRPPPGCSAPAPERPPTPAPCPDSRRACAYRSSIDSRGSFVLSRSARVVGNGM